MSEWGATSQKYGLLLKDLKPVRKKVGMSSTRSIVKA
jgi:hypothetical protein